jgi:hypothetical protein
MQCITVQQPWASLLVSGATRYLVRDWRTSHRGPLAIQAGSKFPAANAQLCADPAMRDLLHRYGFRTPYELPTRAVIGAVALEQCIPVNDDTRPRFEPADPAVLFGLVHAGAWAWVCASPERYLRPVSMAGRLGLFTVPNDLPAAG